MPTSPAMTTISGKRFLFVFCSMELGGAERQGLHLARFLKDLGGDVRVWSTYAGHGLAADCCDAAGIPWSVQRFRWPCRKSSFVRDIWRTILALRRVRPDVILPYTTWPNIVCGLTWRFSSASTCIWGQRSAGDLRGDSVERFAYRRVSGVICNAAHEMAYLRRLLGDTLAPMVVVHNGIELAPARETRAQWRSKLGINTNAAVVTMVANFRPVKDHATLLKAWHEVLTAMPGGAETPRLLLAGAPQHGYSAVRSLAVELGLDDTVIFLDQVKDVSGLLAASDVGVLTSKNEGLPNALIECMASGLPVVATDVAGNREALGDDPRQPFSRVGDPADLAERLRQVLGNRDLGRILGELNRQRASAEFSVESMCHAMVRIIDSHVDGKHAGDNTHT